MGPPGFDPNPALEALKPGMLKCYTDARILVPDLHGKLALEELPVTAITEVLASRCT